MNKDEIVVPILNAINDLREEVRENRKEIQKNREAIQENTRLKLIDQPMRFNYTTKNNTETVVEMLTLELTKTLKGSDV